MNGPPSESKKAAAPLRAMMSQAVPPAPKPVVSGGAVEATTARNAGDQYLFTMKKPVTLARRESAMFPLVEERVKAERVSVFSGEKAAYGGMIHPLLCAELEKGSTGEQIGLLASPQAMGRLALFEQSFAGFGAQVDGLFLNAQGLRAPTLDQPPMCPTHLASVTGLVLALPALVNNGLTGVKTLEQVGGESGVPLGSLPSAGQIAQ